MLSIIALLFSPPVVNFIEVLLVGVFLTTPELLSRLRKTLQQPLVVTALIFWAFISIGTFYSIAPLSDTLLMLLGWRKILLLPLAAAVFDNTPWKLRIVWGFFLVTVVCAIFSVIGWVVNFPVYKYPPGIIIRNYATQGMMFAVAAFGGAMLLRFFPPSTLLRKNMLLLSIAGLIYNIVYLTPGRSGYLAFIVLAMIFTIYTMRGWLRYSFTVLVIVGTMLLLFTSPTANYRLTEGMEQIQSYDSSRESSSMGIRMVFWKNTLKLIEEHPWLGYGTGAFEEAYRRIVAHNETGWHRQVTGDPHNQFLKIIAEHGLFGFILFLAFLISALLARPSPVFRVLAVGVLCAWCSTSLFSSHFSTFSEGTFLFLWLGVMLTPEAK
jgi:O-antigen ligase